MNDHEYVTLRNDLDALDGANEHFQAARSAGVPFTMALQELTDANDQLLRDVRDLLANQDHVEDDELDAIEEARES